MREKEEKDTLGSQEPAPVRRRKKESAART